LLRRLKQQAKYVLFRRFTHVTLCQRGICYDTWSGSRDPFVNFWT